MRITTLALISFIGFGISAQAQTAPATTTKTLNFIVSGGVAIAPCVNSARVVASRAEGVTSVVASKTNDRLDGNLSVTFVSPPGSQPSIVKAVKSACPFIDLK